VLRHAGLAEEFAELPDDWSEVAVDPADLGAGAGLALAVCAAAALRAAGDAAGEDLNSRPTPILTPRNATITTTAAMARAIAAPLPERRVRRERERVVTSRREDALRRSRSVPGV